MTTVDPIQEYRKGDFLVSTDRSKLDVDGIHEFLTNCYWAKGIPKETVLRSIANSLCFGVYGTPTSETFSCWRGSGDTAWVSG